MSPSLDISTIMIHVIVNADEEESARIQRLGAKASSNKVAGTQKKSNAGVAATSKPSFITQAHTTESLNSAFQPSVYNYQPSDSYSSNPAHVPRNPYQQPVYNYNYSYPSMYDGTDNYRYQTEADGLADIEPIVLEGLGDITSDNLNHVELVRSKTAVVETHVNYKTDNSKRKRKHAATEAAEWQSANFYSKFNKADDTLRTAGTSTSRPNTVSVIAGGNYVPNTETSESLAQTNVKDLNKTASLKVAGGSNQPELYLPLNKKAPVKVDSGHNQPDMSTAACKLVIRPAPLRENKHVFVPRQLKSAMDAAANAAHELVVAASTKLGKVQQVHLPKHIETQIRSESGQHVADQTTVDIRNRIKQVGCCT